MAEELSLDRVIAEVPPDEKSAVIAQLQAEGKLVAIMGGGVNDAPALAPADVAVETADIVLVENDRREAVDVIRLAQAARREMIQNLWWPPAIASSPSRWPRGHWPRRAFS